MKNKQLRTLEEIGKDLDKVYSMPCRPDWRRPREGFIFDEEKSVRWNKEEVLRKQAEYEDEVKRLNTEKNKKCDALKEEIYLVISNEFNGISVNEAKCIFDYAYQEKSGYGFSDIISFIYDLSDVFSPMLKR